MAVVDYLRSAGERFPHRTAVTKLHPDAVLAEFFLYCRQRSMKHHPPMIDQADRIAPSFRLLHVVGGEYHCFSIPFQFKKRLLEDDLVDRIKSREGLIKDDNARIMKDGNDELDFLLVTF